MSLIRIFGIVVGVFVIGFAFARFRGNRIRRMEFAFQASFGIALVAVGAFPGLVSLLRDMLALSPAQFSRLIAILIVSTVALWLLLLSFRTRFALLTDHFDRLVRQMTVAEFVARYPAVTELPGVVVVIPAFNEEENIGQVLADIPANVCGQPVATIVIDDGSSDGTLEKARAQGAFGVRNPMNRGGGAALRAGFDIATRFNSLVVVTMDADGQHLPQEIPELVAPVLAGELDFVIGSRILGQREVDSWVRLVGIYVFSTLIRLLTAVRITDCSNGFRALRTEALKRVTLRQDQFHTSELIIDAAKKGFRVGERPITVKKRSSGTSKKGGILSYGLSFMRTIVTSWWR